MNYRIAGPDIFSKTPNIRGGGQGPSIAEIMSEHGVHFNPGDPDRILGKQQCHERFRVPEDGAHPMAMISTDKCPQWGRTVPVLALDDNNIEDVETKQEDHSYDETKIAFMSRPISPVKSKPEDTRIDKIIKRVLSTKSKDVLDEIHTEKYT